MEAYHRNIGDERFPGEHFFSFPETPEWPTYIVDAGVLREAVVRRGEDCCEEEDLPMVSCEVCGDVSLPFPVYYGNTVQVFVCGGCRGAERSRRAAVALRRLQAYRSRREVSLQQVAGVLDVPVDRIYAWRLCGVSPFKKWRRAPREEGGVVFFLVRDVLRFLQDRLRDVDDMHPLWRNYRGFYKAALSG